MLEGKPVSLPLNAVVERYTEIERENRILLEKMTHIMQTTNPTTSAAAANAASGARGNLYTASAILPHNQSI
jgi:hypothetical protein